MKSSLLGLIAHPFSSPTGAKDLYGQDLKTDMQDVFRLSLEKDPNEYIEAIREMDNFQWITTYDNENRIREIYNDRIVQEYCIQYSANKTRKEIELIFHSPITRIESYENVTLN